MELEELKATWQTLEQQMKRGNAINLALYHHQQLAKTRSTLRPLVVGQILQLFGGILVVLFAALLWGTKPTTVPVIVAGVIVHLYGIVCIVAAAVILNAIRNLDYDGSVLEIQDKLARVRRAYVISGIIGGLPWWFLWMPFLMVLLGLVHVNLYANAPSVIWLGVGVGVVGLLAMLWLYRYSRTTAHAGVRRFVDQAVVGRSLLRVQQQLEEIRRFGQEPA
jgi:hypothetical protein